jgi:hypothetical protein
MLKKKNNIFNYSIVFLLCLIIILLIFNLFNNFYIYKKEIYSSFIVSKQMGFDLNSTALTFGFIMPGNSATREISIGNNFKEDVKIKIISEGEISRFLKISEDSFMLKPGESRNIGFSLVVPKNSLLKKYEGKVIVLYNK